MEPLKRLTSAAVKDGLVTMLNKCPTVHPNKTWTDQGREVEGEFFKFSKTVGINQKHLFSGRKAAFDGPAI